MNLIVSDYEAVLRWPWCTLYLSKGLWRLFHY